MRIFTCGAEENDLTNTLWHSATGTFSVVTSTVHGGTYAFKADPAGATGFVTRQFGPLVGGTFWQRTYWNFSTFPTSVAIMTFAQGSAAGSAAVVTVGIISGTGSAKFLLQAAGSTVTTTVSGTVSLVASRWYRLLLTHNLGAGSVGSLTLAVYSGEELSALETLSVSGNAINANIGSFRMGILTTSTATAFIDDVAVNTTALVDTFTGETGPPGPAKIELVKPTEDLAMVSARNEVAWKVGGTARPATLASAVNELPGAPNDGTDYVFARGPTGQGKRLPVARFGMGALTASDAAELVVAETWARVGSDKTAEAPMRLYFQVNDAAWALYSLSGFSHGVPGGQIVIATDGWRILETREPVAATLAGVGVSQFNAGALVFCQSEGPGMEQRRVTAVWTNVEYAAT